MRDRLGAIITGIFRTRDELSLRNLRGGLWPLLLVFPLTVIIGDLCYFDLNISVAGFESYELMLFPLGLGWLVLAWTPKRLVIPFLRAGAIISAVLLVSRLLMPAGITAGATMLGLSMAFQFFNGLCAACAFSLFCFELNNVERLFGMALIQFYYGFYYTIWRAFPAVQAAGKTWGSAVVMAFYLVVVFLSARIFRSFTFRSLTVGSLSSGSSGSDSPGSDSPRHEGLLDMDSDGKDSAVPFIIGLDIIYYIIMSMINYIEWAENSVSSSAFGLGAFLAIAFVIVIQVLGNRSAMYIWLLFLALSLLGLGVLLYDSPAAFFSGSFAYGLGDGLGYIIIYYIGSAAVKQSKSYKMFRLYCIKFFGEYFIISGIFSLLFRSFDAPYKVLAFAVMLIMGSFSLLFMPLMQKKLFETDWTDGLFLQDMEEYSDSLSEVKAIDAKNKLNLTSREQELFTLLFEDKTPKEIAYTLKVSYDTIRFHQKNLYRKLGIRSRTELFVKYLPGGNTKDS